MCSLTLKFNLLDLPLNLLLGGLGSLSQFLDLLEILVPDCFDLRLEVLEAIALLGLDAHQLNHSRVTFFLSYSFSWMRANYSA